MWQWPRISMVSTQILGNNYLDFAETKFREPYTSKMILETLVGPECFCPVAVPETPEAPGRLLGEHFALAGPYTS